MHQIGRKMANVQCLFACAYMLLEGGLLLASINLTGDQEGCVWKCVCVRCCTLARVKARGLLTWRINLA